MAESTAAIGAVDRHVWPAEARHLTAIRAQIRRWLRPLHLTPADEHDIVTAVNEAASNAIEHAYTPASSDDTVQLTYVVDQAGMCFEVVDHGTWRTPSSQDNGRGRGFPIMRRLIDSVVVHLDAGGTRIVLRHPLPASALVPSVQVVQ